MQNYIVKSGDTISKIARDVLNDINRWPEIAQLNNLKPVPGNGIASGIYLIYPGDKLVLPDAMWVYKAPEETPAAADKPAPAESSNAGAWVIGLLVVALATTAVVINQHRKKKKKQHQMGGLGNKASAIRGYTHGKSKKSGKIVKILGQEVREGTKEHARLVERKRLFDQHPANEL